MITPEPVFGSSRVYSRGTTKCPKKGSSDIREKPRRCIWKVATMLTTAGPARSTAETMDVRRDTLIASLAVIRPDGESSGPLSPNELFRSADSVASADPDCAGFSIEDVRACVSLPADDNPLIVLSESGNATTRKTMPTRAPTKAASMYHNAIGVRLAVR